MIGLTPVYSSAPCSTMHLFDLFGRIREFLTAVGKRFGTVARRAPATANVVALAALCEPRCANFAAAAAPCERSGPEFVASVALCEPHSSDVPAGAALCETRSANFLAVAVFWCMCALTCVLPRVPNWKGIGARLMDRPQAGCFSRAHGMRISLQRANDSCVL